MPQSSNDFISKYKHKIQIQNTETTKMSKTTTNNNLTPQDKYSEWIETINVEWDVITMQLSG